MVLKKVEELSRLICAVPRARVVRWIVAMRVVSGPAGAFSKTSNQTFFHKLSPALAPPEGE